MKVKMAREKIEINAEQIKDLASYGCTIVEMAHYFKCDESTIRKRFEAEIKAGRSDGKIRLRQKQYDVAMDGNVGMLVWLGKQVLNQTDHGDESITIPIGDTAKFKIEIVQTGGENGGDGSDE